MSNSLSVLGPLFPYKLTCCVINVVFINSLNTVQHTYLDTTKEGNFVNISQNT